MSHRQQVHRSKGLARGYATGKYAVGIDHRSGFKVPLKSLKYEPGTNYLVTEEENDWDHNIVTDLLNFPPTKKTERIALRWSFPDVPLSIGTIVSADHLYLPAYISVSNQFLQYTSIATGVSVSIGAGVSGVVSPSLDFSISTNSQYYLIVFPGI
jgi:hypothetical protein